MSVTITWGGGGVNKGSKVTASSEIMSDPKKWRWSAFFMIRVSCIYQYLAIHFNWALADAQYSKPTLEVFSHIGIQFEILGDKTVCSLILSQLFTMSYKISLHLSAPTDHFIEIRSSKMLMMKSNSMGHKV